MQASFHTANRQAFYDQMKPASLLLVFSGEEVRKTNDEFYPFFADRNFVYLTGLDCKEAVLAAVKDDNGTVHETLYLLPPDPYAERWTGRRVKPQEATDLSGIHDIRTGAWAPEMHSLLTGLRRIPACSSLKHLYLDQFRQSPSDRDRPAQKFLAVVQKEYPFLRIEDASVILRRLRLIKTPEEIDAIRKAEEITRSGILAMMRASRPGMWEYQYKAEFDHALGQYGPQGPGFPSIISAGRNNFCIHYYSYTGQAADGDMVLADVGGCWDHHTADVSRGFPCNGSFSPQQKLLFECMQHTSDYLFSIIRPGMPMEDVDATIRACNARQMMDAGILKREEDIGTYMWHGGAHHIGYDVHDVVERPEVLAPGMVFCVDIGIYHEAWGIGFRLEDNCLVTENGCENLSREIPRTVADIEAIMCS